MEVRRSLAFRERDTLFTYSREFGGTTAAFGGAPFILGKQRRFFCEVQHVLWFALHLWLQHVPKWNFQHLRPLLRCQRGDEVQSLLRHSSKRLSSGPLLCCSRLGRNRGCSLIMLSSAEEPAARLPSQAFMFAGLRRCLVRVLTSKTADYCLSPLCELCTLRRITPPFLPRTPLPNQARKGGISDSPVYDRGSSRSRKPHH